MASVTPSLGLSTTSPYVLALPPPIELILDVLTVFQAAVEVEAMEPTNPELAATIQSMKDRGIGILYGRWLIEGAPRVLLFDTKTAYGYMNEWKADLWNVASIPSPDNDDETNEAVVFGYLVAWFLGEVSNLLLCTLGQAAN
jgi:glycogen(starch) synthase